MFSPFLGAGIVFISFRCSKTPFFLSFVYFRPVLFLFLFNLFTFPKSLSFIVIQLHTPTSAISPWDWIDNRKRLYCHHHYLHLLFFRLYYLVYVPFYCIVYFVSVTFSFPRFEILVLFATVLCLCLCFFGFYI